ncbi:MAG: T9SS type A sorting domain-containing protein [Bacteroidales bacterium]
MKRKLLFFAIGILIVNIAKTQNFNYQYDNNGNRIIREVIVLSNKSSNTSILNDSLEIQDKMTFSKDNVKIYPNPTKGNLKIEFDNNSSLDDVNITIIDMKGSVIYHSDNISNSNIINMSEAPTGAYILNIRTNTKKYDWKIIKE